MKKALITGITGQDGSYLTELLISKGYQVHGLIRRSSTFNTDRLNHLYQDPHEGNLNCILHYGDLSDSSNLSRLMDQIEPDEVYNLGAQSHVRVSFEQPEYTADIVGTGTLRMLEAFRNHVSKSGKPAKFYQAGSSEMFGAAKPPQDESTPFYPRSPYAVGKVTGFWNAVNYREAYDLFICNGILFNHESPRRGETFVTRKITRAAGRIKMGLQKKLYLGNLEARRDFGHAKDYVRAMWQMLQCEEPGDFVVATGKAYSVREFLDVTFGLADLDWHQYVEIDPRYFRPTEVDYLLGDPSRITSTIGWEPEISFHSMVEEMYQKDLELARQEKTLKDNGHLFFAQAALMH